MSESEIGSKGDSRSIPTGDEEIETASSSSRGNDIRPRMAMPYPMQMAIPQPGTAAVPCFEGSRASESVADFDATCDDIQLNDLQRLKHCAECYHQRKDKDVIQPLTTLRFLEALKNQPRTGTVAAKQFGRQFRQSAKYLIDNGLLSEFHACLWFLTGLPDDLRSDVIMELHIDLDQPSLWKLDAMFDCMTKHCRSIEMMNIIRRPTYPVSAREAENDVPTSRITAQMQLAQPPPVQSVRVPLPDQQQILPASYEDYPNEYLDRLAGMLIKRLEAEGFPLTEHNIRRLAEIWDNPVLQNNKKVRRSKRCYFCGALGHGVRGCELRQEMLKAGCCHYNERHRLCIGPKEDYGPELIRVRGFSDSELINQQLERWQRGRRERRERKRVELSGKTGYIRIL